ncbi:MAG TPA: Hpt domain-containing protein [Nitrospira sp.]|nr:Hpt domain-containing protein [Nitrospira sp.]
MEQIPLDPTAMAQKKEVVLVDASFEPLIQKFMANRKKEIVAMREALDSQNFEMVRTIAHGMKGVGGSYGFDRVTDIATAIEHAAKAADAEAIRRELPVLESYLGCVEIVYE